MFELDADVLELAAAHVVLHLELSDERAIEEEQSQRHEELAVGVADALRPVDLSQCAVG